MAARTPENSTPILVGCGDVTDMVTPIEQGRPPFDLMAAAARLAIADSGIPDFAKHIDTVATIRLFADTSHRFASKLGTSSNPPRSVAKRLGIQAARYIYTGSGGNMPQYLVNLFAEQIASGEMRAGLVVGGEALRTQLGVERAGLPVSWAEDPGGQPEFIGDPRRGWSNYEDRHQMRAAIVMYPLIENAIRASRGNSVSQHLQSMGRLLEKFAQVAAGNPLATRRAGYSSEQLANVDEQNRWIGFPYPRLMNSNAFVDQAAALILTSVGFARKLGIKAEKWIYLHGCADAHDHWHVSERVELHRSPALRAVFRKTLDMAQLQIETPHEAARENSRIRLFDLYSCFPSAVEIACQEMGVREDDPRPLTVTGGLPFFGGPGNNYVTHSIAEMTRRLRAAPGTFGMVTANGNYITKHSFGVYSTLPFPGPWHRENPAILQGELDRQPKAALIEDPTGEAVVETYTVMHGKNGPEFAVIIGRLKENGRRFLANTPTDGSILEDLQKHDGLGRTGFVQGSDGRNLFTWRS